MFTINGEHWKVVLCSEHHPMLIRSDGSLSVGACDDASKTIYLNGDLRGDFFKKGAVPRTYACSYVLL